MGALVIEHYRIYSKATAGGGAVVKSTSSGGGSTQTSSSGGGVAKSTASGGGSAQSSGISTGWDTNIHTFVSSRPFTAIFDEENYRDHQHTVQFSSDNLEHHHTVNIPTHTHNFDVPNHTHSVKVPSHVHEINIPSHKHDIEYGIYKMDRKPSSVEIKVDGNAIPHTAISGDSIDLIPYLETDSDNRVRRGWHTVEIKPNDLGRINAQLMVQFFMQSRGGVDA